MNEPQYNPRLTGIQNFKIAFEKGKLEQKKEDINILIKYSKLRLYRSKSCQLLIKQLQKEIGGMK